MAAVTVDGLRNVLRGTLLPRSDNERLLIALGAAALLHGVLLFGVRFVAPERAKSSAPTLEVTLSQYSETNPNKADFAAPTSQRGSGDEREKTETTSTQAAPFTSERSQPLPAQQAPGTPDDAIDEVRELTTNSANAPAPPRLARDVPTPGARESLQPTVIDIAREVATLQARLAQEDSTRALGPRIRRITSVSTLATDEAYYLDAWRREVEQLGNLNYPAQARTQRIRGSVRMLVVLRADGTLLEARVLESSGFDILDRAALDIIRLAAPFPVFPESMRKRMEQLEIIRTWQFRPRGQGGADGFGG